MASTSSSTASANGPPCKKQKSGGTFCSAYGCSNRSLRDKQSKHDRNFISYHQFPKDKELRSQWLARLKRDDFVPSPSTKICSDHFFINDFNEADVEKRLQPPAPGSKNRTMRLKSGSIPNTDRLTGEFSDPLNPVERRPITHREYIQPTDTVNDEPASDHLNEDHREIELEETDHWMDAFDHIYSDSEEDYSSDSDTDYWPSSSESDSDVESDREPDDKELEDSADHDWLDSVEHRTEEAQHSIDKFKWAIVNIPLLLTLFKFCPDCGKPNNLLGITSAGFAIGIKYRCLDGHENTWKSSPVANWIYEINIILPAAAVMCGLGYATLVAVMSCLGSPFVQFLDPEMASKYVSDIYVTIINILASKLFHNM